MAIVCSENMNSRQVTEGRSAELIYTIRGTEDQAAAIAALKAQAPLVFAGLARQPVLVEPVHVDTTDPDHCLWTGTVSYDVREYQEPPEVGDSSFAFDTAGGTQHITQSLSTVARYPTATAPDCGGAIGVTADSVEGVDITVPVYAFSETHYFAAATVNDTFKGRLFGLTGKVNAGAFRGLAAGECLFLGASGSRRGTSASDDWEITYKFAGSPNRTGLSVGSITGISKKGWEYLWVRYEDQVDDTANVLVKRPVAVYIERVYENGNFGDLGI